MGKKKGRKKYVQYFLSWDMGFCHGPVDSVEQVYFKEKPVFPEDGSGRVMTPNLVVPINQPELFGGDEREGGIQGDLHVFLGGPDQLQNQAFCDRIGWAINTAPGYRGLVHIGLFGNNVSDNAGACIAANSPSVPPMWARFRRGSYELATNQPIIVNSNNSYDTNPVSFIYEAAINYDWGMGGSPDDLHLPSFIYAANYLGNEGIGISGLWDRQNTIEDFIAEILDHINALYFYDPYIGKARIKLLRNDYDVNSLTQFGPDNCNLLSFRRKLWGETINEVTVNYTDGKTEESASVTFQDPGNVAMQGDVVAQTKSYPFFRTADVASLAAMRDLQTGTAPLASVEFEALRTDWNHLPGDVIKFKWEPYGIENTILRVLEVDWGTVNNAKIKVSLIEDIFSFQLASYNPSQPPIWEDPDQDPNSGDFFDVPAFFFAAPYTLIQQDLSLFAQGNLGDDKYPQTVIGAVVTPYPLKIDPVTGQPLPDQHDMQSFFLHVDGTDPVGNPTWVNVGEKNITGHAVLDEGLPQAAISVMKIRDKRGGEGPRVGRYCIISDRSEYRSEWVMMLEDLGDGSWRVARGVLDTVPRKWDADTRLFFISWSFDAYDMGNTLAFENEHLKIQPRTSKGLRDLDLCPDRVTNRPDRHYLPYRPANVSIETVYFGGWDETQGRWTGDEEDDTWEPRRWMIRVTWARRNRTLEDARVRLWTDPDVEPEPGQTTTILIFGSRMATFGEGGSMGPPTGPEEKPWGEIGRIDGIVGTYHDIDIWAYTQQYEDLAIQVMSQRGEFESLQGLVIDLGLYVKGFGSDYGYAYGGWVPDDSVNRIKGVLSLPKLTSR